MKFMQAIAFFLLNFAAPGCITTNQFYSKDSVQSANCQKSVDLLTVLRNNGLTMFVELIAKAGLEEIFSGNNPLIVLAPTNEAFATMDSATLAAHLHDVNQLRDLLTYHLMLFRQPYTIISAILHELALPTIQAGLVRVNVYRQNGPSFAIEETATANGALLLKAIPAGERIVYVINRVLNAQELSPNNTLTNFLRSNEDLSIFLTIYESIILSRTNMAVLQKTVFVPTNAAFKALPPGFLDSLFANPKDLAVLLNTHTASGTFYVAGLTNGPLTVFSGATIDVDVSTSGINVGGAEIIGPDITVFEGVVHIVDSLIQAGPIPNRQYECTL